MYLTLTEKFLLLITCKIYLTTWWLLWLCFSFIWLNNDQCIKTTMKSISLVPLAERPLCKQYRYYLCHWPQWSEYEYFSVRRLQPGLGSHTPDCDWLLKGGGDVCIWSMYPDWVLSKSMAAHHITLPHRKEQGWQGHGTVYIMVCLQGSNSPLPKLRHITDVHYIQMISKHFKSLQWCFISKQKITK